MLWNDLREFLEKLDEAGELKKVFGANWEDDIGGITELLTESRGCWMLSRSFPKVCAFCIGWRSNKRGAQINRHILRAQLTDGRAGE